MSNFQNASLEQLWAEVLRGDKKSFEKLYRQQASSLVRYGRKFTSDIELIEDAIQETFLSLWTKKGQLEIKNSISDYTYKMFRNELVRKITKNAKFETIDEQYGDFETYMGQVLNDSNITNSKLDEVLKMMDLLPCRQKEAIYLKYVENLPYQTIADLMEVKIPHVYNLIHKGLQDLRAFFKEARVKK
ncbi:hypothetical protein GCM10007049_01900 [Echinicola pacifica]|uniref:RNA polymerase sigma-70 factor, ECF subfamily n=1 Tax=Echinicola pacifica TaxID=346377 RepID=A0A918UJ89_9BACT|nr:sigma-70 family RNA polymerase sigma factor [Echinicola pacifica]GGZ13704.1 hypothetical protein GCM10007049_01900 [Echinicola pacifica]